MKIKSIRIQNYKMAEDVVFENLDKLSCISGRSGSGRSTFIEAIKFIGSAVRIGVQNTITRSDKFTHCNGKNTVFEVNAYEGKVSYKYTLEINNRALVSEKLTFRDTALCKDGTIISNDSRESICIAYSPDDYSVLKRYELCFDENQTVCGALGFKIMGLNQMKSLLDDIFFLKINEDIFRSYAYCDGCYTDRFGITSNGWYKDCLYNLKDDFPKKYKEIISKLMFLNPAIEAVNFDKYKTLYFKYKSMAKELPFYSVNISVHITMALLCLLYTNKMNQVILLENIDKYLDSHELNFFVKEMISKNTNDKSNIIVKDSTGLISLCINDMIERSEIRSEEYNNIRLINNGEEVYVVKDEAEYGCEMI